MRIAVTTPNGHVGRPLTRALVRAGVRPLLLTRDIGRVDAELRGFVEAAEADSWNAAEVAAATKDVDALYWVAPTPTGEDPLGDYSRAADAVSEAVTRNGIARVVFQSSVGAEKRHGAGEIDGLARIELALDALDIDVTHLRCGYFFTNLQLQAEAVRAGTIPVVLPLDAPMAWVAPRDIAEVAAALLLNRDWHGRRVQAVHGPEDLTWNDVAAILTAELGRDVAAVRIGDGEMFAQYLKAGMPSALAEAVLGMSTGLRDGFTPEQRRSPITTTPTPLASWLHTDFKPTL
ncbi:NAD(P)H-binding protein [Actinomadura atramentaria]|uniref:NmrA family NAD(P)-binding protein n=1 Tax=Actinomadura atramentaria TaxID=1990 RepID=UPI00037CB155|nr:NAD(P)H-binding protein [Actinomadura atramentaria]